jgi:BlaI family transcriptional regulator, penicillinase repressor
LSSDGNRRTEKLTPLELRIMQALWKLGSSSVQQVVDELHPERKLAYTTVQTMLNLLVRKKKVVRTLQGRAYVYAPLVSEERARTSAVRDFLDRFFGGSAEALVMNLVDLRKLSPETLDNIARRLESTPAEIETPRRTRKEK